MQPIDVTRHDHVAVLRMAHRHANALDVEILEALGHALDEERESDRRALVITGTGSTFSAGVDLVRLRDGDRAYAEQFLRLLSNGMEALFLFPKPVIAAINGHAIAGGAVLALACDVRLVARGGATIGLPELRVGVPFPLVPAEIVRCALGDAKAQRAMLLGNLVGADRAVDEGYADELVEADRLMDRALELARSLAAIPTASYARTKRNLRRPAAETWRRLREAHDRETLAAWDAPETRAAVREHVQRTLGK